MYLLKSDGAEVAVGTGEVAKAGTVDQPPAGGAGPVAESPAAVYLARLGAGSQRTMRGALERIAELVAGGRRTVETLPWHQLRYQHTQAVRAALVDDDLKPATVNKHLAALRGVLQEAWRLGLMTGEDFHRAADLPSVKGSTLPAGRNVGAGEVAALVAACKADDSAAGSRDVAMLAVAFTAGVRLAELVALDLDDYDPETGEVHVRHGKGKVERLTYVQNGAARAVAAWLEARGEQPGPLFCPINRGGRVTVRPMTGQAVYATFAKRAGAAGVAVFSPHDARRTYAGDLLDAGADIVTVQKLMGHATVATTSRYDRRPEAAKRRAAGLLHFPFLVG